MNAELRRNDAVTEKQNCHAAWAVTMSAIGDCIVIIQTIPTIDLAP
jgi:hypothetical protein